MRRALVSLPDGAWNIIDTDLKGQIDDGDSEVIRNFNFLSNRKRASPHR